MAPRKSTSKASRVSQGPSSQASSSKLTLDSIPPPNVPDSITHDYKPVARPREPLNESDREKLIHELVGFYPMAMCDEVVKAAREGIYSATTGIENWANARYGHSDEISREISIGLYSLESLLESHVDKAFDKFAAWMLRNPFDIRGDHDLVLPWQAGLDFSRGEFVAGLPNGQADLDERLEELRVKTEQARLVSQRLAHAEEALDRRLEIAKQRKAEVGFVKDVLVSSGLSPLPAQAASIRQALSNLHSTVSQLEPHTITHPQLPSNGKAWELGRQAYLNWAVGKVVPPGAASEEVLESIEGEMRESGGSEGVDKLTSALAQ